MVDRVQLTFVYSELEGLKRPKTARDAARVQERPLSESEDADAVSIDSVDSNRVNTVILKLIFFSV